MIDYIKAILILSLVSILSGIAIIEFVTLKSDKNLKTPDLIGNSLYQAKNKTDQLNLKLVIKGFVNSLDIQEGKIAKQDPLPENSIKENGFLEIFLSEGSKQIIFPNLENLFYQNAIAILKNISLENPAIIETYSDKPKGTVIATNISYGRIIKNDERYSILISKGERKQAVQLGSLIGMKLKNGIDLIEKNHLHLDKIDFSPSDSFEEGYIISQTPNPGKKLHEGDRVKIKLSTGSIDYDTDKELNFQLLYYKIENTKKDSVRVKIVSLNQDKETEIYNKIHNKNDIVSLLLKIKGKTKVMIYIDDKLVDIKKF